MVLPATATKADVISFNRARLRAQWRLVETPDNAIFNWQWAASTTGRTTAIQRVAQLTVERGRIFAADGTLMASNVKKKVGEQTLYLRTYRTGKLASNVVGYKPCGNEPIDHARLAVRPAPAGGGDRRHDVLAGVVVVPSAFRGAAPGGMALRAC